LVCFARLNAYSLVLCAYLSPSNAAVIFFIVK
jgi:hypothetical protein